MEIVQEFEALNMEARRRHEAGLTRGYVRKAIAQCEKFWEAHKEVLNNFFQKCGEFWEKVKLQAQIIFSQKVKLNSKRQKLIAWECSPNIAKGNEVFYMVEFYDEDGKIVFCKIGTSKDVRNRIGSEVAKEYKKFGVATAIVKRCWICEDNPETILAESFFRSKFIRLYGSTQFKKNDRFKVKAFDYEEADKEMKQLCPTSIKA